MKEINFIDPKKIKYKVLNNYKDIAEKTKLYRDLDDGVIEYEGETYEVNLYTHDMSLALTHVQTHTIIFSGRDYSVEKNNQIYEKGKYLAAKILEDWMNQTKKLWKKEHTKPRKPRKKVNSELVSSYSRNRIVIYGDAYGL